MKGRIHVVAFPEAHFPPQAWYEASAARCFAKSPLYLL